MPGEVKGDRGVMNEISTSISSNSGCDYSCNVKNLREDSYITIVELQGSNGIGHYTARLAHDFTNGKFELLYIEYEKEIEKYQ